MITIGIDIGSITAKGAVMKNSTVLATKVLFTGYNSKKIGQTLFDHLLKKTQFSSTDISRVVSTGYGRNNVDFSDKTITEITCHAAGVFFQNTSIRTIIDIGGQDSKAISINEMGKVLDFAMNDKCAAGTGRFLEVMARALEVDLENFGALSLKAEHPSTISSLCTVFAESEVISLISKGEPREDIMSGIHNSIASRVSSLTKRVGVIDPIMMTGGVAKNSGVVKALEKKLNKPILVSKWAQENGAIGAAILASKIG